MTDQTILYNEIKKYVPKYIYLNHKSLIDQTEDIIQDIYLKIYNKYNPEKAKMSTYILNVTRNYIIDLSRKSSKYQHIELSDKDILTDQDIYLKIYNKYNPEKGKMSTYILNVTRNYIIDINSKHQYIDILTDHQHNIYDYDMLLSIFSEFSTYLQTTYSRTYSFIFTEKFINQKDDIQIINYINIKKNIYYRYLNNIIMPELKSFIEKNNILFDEILTTYNIKNKNRYNVTKTTGKK